MPHGGPPTERSEDRALLLRLSDDNWPIVSVKHRKDVYAHLDRLAYSVNRVTGGIDYVGLQVVREEVLKSGARRVPGSISRGTSGTPQTTDRSAAAPRWWWWW